MNSAIICSDSREAVPFPTEIISISYFFTSFAKVSFASLTLFCGAVGYITVVSRIFPVASTTASLQPVLNAGSQPRTVLPPIGGCMRSCSRLLANIFIAPSCAPIVSSFLISVSIDGAMSLLYASAAASSIYC